MSYFERRQSSSSRDIFSTIGAADASSREQQNSCTYIPNFVHFCRDVGRNKNQGGKGGKAFSRRMFCFHSCLNLRGRLTPWPQVPTALFCRAIYLHSRFNFLTSFSLFFLSAYVSKVHFSWSFLIPKGFLTINASCEKVALSVDGVSIEKVQN